MSGVAVTDSLASRLPGGDETNDEHWAEVQVFLPAATLKASAPTIPQGLFGRPCPQHSIDWHRQQLAAIDRDSITDLTGPTRAARRRYHQRMLAHLIAPQRDAWRPLVTILIPVYNRAALLVEAVRSCLAQSWRPVEIIVIDDGSDDDPASALLEFGNDVRLYRQANGGVASARNRGIQLAHGDFIHLLDSDDQLLPDAIERRMAAFAAIADAALCFGMVAEQTTLTGVIAPVIRVPDGTDRCTTSDLLAACIRGYPFFVSTVTMPRWVMLAADPFEEDLRRGEDSRYWFQLGLAGAKVVGFSEPGVARHVLADGLSVTRHIGKAAVDIRLRMLRDILLTPFGWHHAGSVLRQLVGKLNEAAALPIGPLDQISALGQVLAAINGLGDGRPRDSLSPVPLLVEVRDALIRTKPDLSEQWHALWRNLDDALSTALKSAAPMTVHDIAHWGDQPSQNRGQAGISKLLRRLLKPAVKDPALLARIDRVLRRTRPSPAPQSARRYRTLRRKLRSGQLAAWLTWPSAYWSPPR